MVANLSDLGLLGGRESLVIWEWYSIQGHSHTAC